MKKILPLLLCAAMTFVSCQENDDTIPVSEITLDKTELSMAKDGKETLVVTVVPDNVINKEVTWESSDVNVATVSVIGEVTAVKEGEAIITATSVADQTKKATCKVTVAIYVSGVTLNKTDIFLLVGTKATLNATVAPENATNKKVSWMSNAEDVATVSETGEVTPLKKGTATITATTEDGAKAASCVVTVIDENTTRCQVVNNVTPVSSTVGANGTMYGTNIIFYSDNAEVGVTSIKDVSPSGGQSPLVAALAGATRARVSFKLSPTSGTEYTVDYFSLTANGLTTISITDNTMLTSTKGLTKGAGITLREALNRL